MSRTFTFVKPFNSDGGLIHDFYKVPAGKSAIVDVNVVVIYGYGAGSDTTPDITASVTLKKANGSEGVIDSEVFTPNGTLRVKKCALESGDTIGISASTTRGAKFGTYAYVGGVLIQ